MNFSGVSKALSANRGLLVLRDLPAAERRAIERLAARLDIDRPHPGVLAFPHEASDLRRAEEVLLWVGGDAFLTGYSGLWNHGLVSALESRVHLGVAHNRRNRPAAKTHRLTRSRHHAAAGIAMLKGLPTASVAWCLTDIASTAATSSLRKFVIDARQQRILTLDELAALLDIRGPIPGRGKLVRLVAEQDEERVDSMLELGIRGRIKRSSLPAPEPAPVPVRAADGVTVEVDIGWLPQCVGLDCLGMGAHSSRAHLDADVTRENSLVDTPWAVYQATWSHLDDDERWAALERRIGHTLRQRSA